jgi:hypothetical protein
MIQQKTDA